MVYDKKKSGDPDHDDKQPIAAHGGRITKGPDGRDVLMSEVLGPVDAYTGEHVNLDGPTAEDLDNRPAPGEVAKEASEVQTYSAEDTPAADRDPEDDSSDAKAAPDSTATTPKSRRTAK